MSFVVEHTKENSEEVSVTTLTKGFINLPKEELHTENEETEDEHTLNSILIQFNHFREAALYILVFFYLVDIGLDIWVAKKLFTEKQLRQAWFVMFCILLPNLYAGYKSLQWYLRAHDEEPITRILPWVLRVMFFPLSLILRYFDSWVYGYGSREARKDQDFNTEIKLFSLYMIESAEVSMLRLFIIFLEDAPIAVLNVKGIFVSADGSYYMELSMVLFKLFFTMTTGVVHFITSMKAVYHAAKYDRNFIELQFLNKRKLSQFWTKRSFLTAPAQITIYLWHLFAIGTRLLGFAMFIVVQQKFVWLLVSVRWLINTIAIKIDAWEISPTNCVAFGGVYLFTFVPTSSKDQFLRILVYCGINFVESVIISILFKEYMSESWMHKVALASLFIGTIISMSFMGLYYGFFHPTKSLKSCFECCKENENKYL